MNVTRLNRSTTQVAIAAEPCVPPCCTSSRLAHHCFPQTQGPSSLLECVEGLNIQEEVLLGGNILQINPMAPAARQKRWCKCHMRIKAWGAWCSKSIHSLQMHHWHLADSFQTNAETRRSTINREHVQCPQTNTRALYVGFLGCTSRSNRLVLDPSFPSAPLWFHLEPLGVLSSAAALQHKDETTLSQWALPESSIE